LEKTYADIRSSHLSDINYDLKIDLTKEEYFTGISEINFKLKEIFYLTLDFTKGKVSKLVVNDSEVKNIKEFKHFIEIPEKYLNVGKNIIKVEYTHEYSKNGAGLYRFVDSVDKRIYLYSDFEPYDAHQMFPCFDQPNLKARFTTEVTVPKKWQVISANREVSIFDNGKQDTWKFPITDPLSTYNFSIHAGEYQVWESLAKTKIQEIPLRLFARQSMSRYIDPKEWFELSQSGFVFFENYFSTAYHYKKYDQLIVPDFNSGAMENTAAVTFNEDRFVSRSEKTRDEKRKLASVIYHEMAHMWFGNLVTMSWWDDLWLNESFATYSSAVGLLESTDYKEIWEVFNILSKQRAYVLDQSINTHPIVMEVESTEKAFTNFDGITYGKGASVLKQLAFYVGEKNYKKALKNYFAKFSNGNTTLKDFMSSMKEVVKLDLQSWEDRWLKTSMVNDVEVHYTCSKGRINYFEIYQTATQEEPMLRTHKTKVAILKKWQGIYRIHRSKEVEYSGERTLVKAFVGEVCPDIAYPNYMDNDYVTVTFDKRSLKNIENDLLYIDDSFLRSSIWSDLWLMVLNKKMDMGRYLEIVEFNGLNESNIDALESILAHVAQILNEYFPQDNEEWQKKRLVWLKYFEQAYLAKIKDLSIEIPSQKIWFESLIGIADSLEIHNELAKILENKKSMITLKYSPDQDLRWRILAQLVSHDHPKAQELFTLEKKRDPSLRGQRQIIFISSLKPDVKTKQSVFDQLNTVSTETKFSDLKIMMSGLFPSNQSQMQKMFSDEYYKTLKAIYKKADHLFLVSFANLLTPKFCDQESSDKVENFLKADKTMSLGLIKSLKSTLFENQRCMEMQKLFKTDESLQKASIN
jgi:aminopeptidase N